MIIVNFADMEVIGILIFSPHTNSNWKKINFDDMEVTGFSNTNSNWTEKQ